jgi:hypothetical protein
VNGRRTLAATPAPKRKTRFGPPVGGRCPCPRSLKASRKTSPPRVGLFPDMERAVLPSLRPQSSAWPRPSRPFSLVKTRRRPCACSVCRGSPRRRGRAGHFYADPEGFRLASLPSGPPRGWAGDDERGFLARDAALHIPACVRNRHGALWQAAFRVAGHGAVDAGPQGSRERHWSRACPRSWGRGEGSRRGVFVG